MAELFQARVFATGRLYLPSPPAAESFAVPFVLDYHGRRFSKYPPGHAALLAAGVLLGDPWLINPLLGAIGLALTHALARRLAGRRAAEWAVWLGAVSPFYIMTAGTLGQHPASLVLGTLFVLGLLRPRWDRPALDWASGLALGLTAVVRPYTALLLALPAFGFYLLRERFPRPDRRNGSALSPAVRRTLRVGLGAALAAALLPLYNYALTGQLRLSLYTLYWPYDSLGFGPLTGPHGFALAQALSDTGKGLLQLAHDLHGWPYLSLILPLIGLAAGRRRAEGWLLATLPAALVIGYLLYFH
ncbi:MAG: glycosyltransferase family 39 protein, partial [Chloroflexi bacterium]|nr:glycosyltransferase family 39 protein [Chloroflexota bacterium]